MSEGVNRAVFLSYASQDVEAAKRICEALRDGGAEVWFDAEGGLEHGGEWDAKIRRQVKECIFFIPLISVSTQARLEGYFRLEWDIAAERARTIAAGVPFILPVVIDDTREPDALVPDRFRVVQWTRLPGGVVPPEVQARFLKLWSERIGAQPKDGAPARTAAYHPPTLPPLASGQTRAPGMGGPTTAATTFGERRLAAIVFTDVVGYSARMQRDEPGTLALVHSDFTLMREVCERLGGEVLNTMGDGMLLSFSSAVHAVECALQVQSDFGARRARVAPEQALEHRLGIHLGDVYRPESGGVAGDGVNIAARLQTKAPAGGICISQTVHETVKGKLAMQAVFLGSESFKNITEAIPIWHIAPESAPALAQAPSTAAAKRITPRPRWLAPALAASVILVVAGWWFWRERGPKVATPLAAAMAVDKPAIAAKSVAVLAFEDMSKDKADESFGDGISEELLNVLAKVPGLHVTARTSSFFFKGKQVQLGEIARQLGVAYVVEGSVRRSGSQVRITAQLIKAADGFHVWSDTFTRELKEIFAVQDEIAGLIAQNLQLKLGTSQRAAKEVNPEAHRLVLEGQYFLNLRTLDGFTKAEGAFTKALALDAEFAPAHAGLADTLQVRASSRVRGGASMREVGEDWRRALTMAQRAKELDPTLPEPYATLGYALMIEQQFPEADEQFRRAVELNPNYARAYSYRAAIWLSKGRLDECIRQNEKSGEVDPLWMPFLGAQGDYLFYAQRLAEALKITDRAMMLQPTGVTALGARARVQLALGLKAEAIATARFIRSHPESGIRRDADISAIYVLGQAGLSQEAEAYADERFKALSQSSFQRGGVLGALGRFDEALPFLERTPTVSLPALVWDPMWDPWRSDPRFEKLFEKLNFTEPYKAGRATLARMLAEQAAKK